jgi:hypothetical protein
MSEGSGPGDARETTEGLGVGVDDRLEGGDERVIDELGLGGTAVANAAGSADDRERPSESRSFDRGGLAITEVLVPNA